MIQLNVSSNFSGEQIAKQMPKAFALAITRSATDAQGAIQRELQRQFTIRGPWWKKGNKFGIKVVPADKSATPITAEVGTNADWLSIHEDGGTKKRKSRGRTKSVSSTDETFKQLVSGKSLIAIPTKNVRRTSRQIIQKKDKPFNLKRAFAVNTKRGNILIMSRTGRGKKSEALPYYLLRKTVQIYRASTVIDPAVTAIGAGINANFRYAFARTITRGNKKKI